VFPGRPTMGLPRYLGHEPSNASGYNDLCKVEMIEVPLAQLVQLFGVVVFNILDARLPSVIFSESETSTYIACTP
jgi:hypothetical protein